MKPIQIKYAILIFCISFGIIASGFAMDANLDTQINTTYNTQLNEFNEIELKRTIPNVQDLSLSPNFGASINKLQLLSTENGLLKSTKINDDFIRESGWPSALDQNSVEIKYAKNFETTNILLAIVGTEIYISYDRGFSFELITHSVSEEIINVEFTPNFSTSRDILVATANEVYRVNASTGFTEVFLNEPVNDILFLHSPNASNNIYVVQDDVIKYTADYGNNWTSKTVADGIQKAVIMPNGFSVGNVFVITNSGNLQFMSNSMSSFQDYLLPTDVSTVQDIKYQIDEEGDTNGYIILTDNGFYIDYLNDTAKWKAYNGVQNAGLVDDFELTKVNFNDTLFVIQSGVLYKDISLTGTLAEYMPGISTDVPYVSQGEVISQNLIALSEQSLQADEVVASATLTPTEQLNEQTITYYMSLDGYNWEQITPGVEHEFVSQGQELIWKAVLETSDTAASPILQDVQVDYTTMQATNCAGFTDIAIDDPDCPVYQYVKTNGIFTGYPDGTFQPDNEINRAETVKVIVEGFDVPLIETDGTDLGFSDVGVDEWYMGYLKTAFEAGIIEGYPDGTFMPSETVIYVEMLKIFFETAGVTIDEVEPAQEWYEEYVNYANTNNLVPYDDVTTGMKRVDVAKLFYQWSQI